MGMTQDQNLPVAFKEHKARNKIWLSFAAKICYLKKNHKIMRLILFDTDKDCWLEVSN